MNVDIYGIAALLAVFLLFYLFVMLLRGEKF